jgi:hypothetical protein
MANFVKQVIKILEDSDKKIIDTYDLYASGNEELMIFARDGIDDLINEIINKKWYDDIGQPLN